MWLQNNSILTYLFSLGMLCTLSNCAVKSPPEHEDLQQQAFTNFVLPSTWENSADTTSIKNNWLSTFNDPVLDTLVHEALVHNPDLRISSARIDQANGYVQAAQAALRPALSILGRETSKLGADLGNGLNGALFAASWEIDIWGRLRNAREAEKANKAAFVADSSYANLSIAARVTKLYYLASETFLQMELATQMMTLSEDMLSISEKRYDIGVGNEIDVVNVKANLNNLKDALSQLELAYANQLRALELLLGRYPLAAIEVKKSLVEIQTQIPAGIPLQLLERRPDILAAQFRFNAAFYRVGEAKAAQLPRINLTANFGLLDSEILTLAENFSNPVQSVGGELIAPIYQGGGLKANVYIRNAEQREAVELYYRTVLNAFSDVENTLDAIFKTDEREQFLKKAVAHNSKAFQLEQIRYKIGQVDMRNLIDQQMDLYQSQTKLLHIQSEKIIQRVNLFLALGGSM